HAETVMELALLDASITGTTMLQGDFEDGTRWIVSVNEYSVAPMRPLPLGMQSVPLPVKMLVYQVEVTGGQSPNADYRLESLKVVSTIKREGPLGGTGATRMIVR